MDKEPAIASRLELARTQLLADAGVQKYLKTITPPTRNCMPTTTPMSPAWTRPSITPAHILVAAKDKDLAIQLIKKLKAGAKFDDLAKANSIDPGSKAMGGDLGWFTVTNMVKPFGDGGQDLEERRNHSEPVETQYGWHIVKLEDTRETVPPTFEQHKAQSNNAVIQKKFKDYIDGLKKNAKIEKSL